jgi:hypothetical protein
MAYRKIIVDGQQHEYIVGKSFVKFRGGKAVPIAEIGELYHDGGIVVDIMVRPGLIRKYLQEERGGGTYFVDGHLHGSG